MAVAAGVPGGHFHERMSLANYLTKHFRCTICIQFSAQGHFTRNMKTDRD